MSCGVFEIKCEKILAASQIPLGDVVVNPYRGCAFGCAYCYVRLNKYVRKRDEAWGSFVDVKVNALDVLEKELQVQSPQRVLLGSTTEVYQPVEKNYQLTRRIIERLNRAAIPVTIMTRSPLIERDIELLKNNPDPVIYFTLSPLPVSVQTGLEPGAPDNALRCVAIEHLVHAKLTVHVYANPVIPFVSDCQEIFNAHKDKVEYIDFEGINLAMIDAKKVIHLVEQSGCDAQQVAAVFSSQKKWERYWNKKESEVHAWKKPPAMKLQFFSHPFSEYFRILDYKQK